MKLTKNELQKLFTACNVFLITNSVGPDTEKEWAALKEKIKKELAARHNFICK